MPLVVDDALRECCSPQGIMANDIPTLLATAVRVMIFSSVDNKYRTTAVEK
jgi:hypothetical protein